MIGRRCGSYTSIFSFSFSSWKMNLITFRFAMKMNLFCCVFQSQFWTHVRKVTIKVTNEVRMYNACNFGGVIQHTKSSVRWMSFRIEDSKTRILCAKSIHRAIWWMAKWYAARLKHWKQCNASFNTGAHVGNVSDDGF